MSRAPATPGRPVVIPGVHPRTEFAVPRPDGTHRHIQIPAIGEEAEAGLAKFMEDRK